MSTLHRDGTAKEALYIRLIDELPNDDLHLARQVLDLLRTRGRLGRLKFEELRHLSPEQLVALRNALVHGHWAISHAATSEEPITELQPEDRFKRHLLESGLLAEIKLPRRPEPRRDRAPVELRGRPLSEEIIEERR